MNQSRYNEKILSKFDKADCKSCSTPCEMDITKTSDGVDLINTKYYREIIVSLIYIMGATRPGICYIVTTLSHGLTKPNYFHLTKVKHVLRYLKRTINQSSLFKKSKKPLELKIL